MVYGRSQMLFRQLDMISIGIQFQFVRKLKTVCERKFTVPLIATCVMRSSQLYVVYLEINTVILFYNSKFI